MMFGKNTQSQTLMHRVPANSVGCEIGVWKGETSTLFLKRKLKELHLVDPYEVPDDPATKKWLLERYVPLVGSADENAYQDFYDKLYNQMKVKFKAHPEVTFHRKTSEDYFNSIEDRSLDWIYIDGDHSYEGCKYDLDQAWIKVKKGGSIFGDDYKWGISKWGKEGVIKAVDDFVAEHKVQLRAYGETQFEIKVA